MSTTKTGSAEPAPGAPASAPPVARRAAVSPASGYLSLIAAGAAVGVLAVAVAFAGAREGESLADPLFWIGLGLIVGPICFRLLGSGAGYGERLGLIIALGLALYAVKVLHSPDGFTFHDELGQYRATDDILRTGQLYSDNPVVEVYPLYPGLQAVTAALSAMSGLSIFVSGLIVVGLARLVLMVALFAFLARISGSSRVAGLGTLIYAANPNFVFFDAQFSYESLAVPLAAACLLATVWAARAGPGRAWATGVAIVILAGTVVTHHLTSYALVAGLVAFCLIAAVQRRWGFLLGPVPAIAVSGIVLAAAWWLVAGRETGSQLGPVLADAGAGLWDVVTGQRSGKAPFTAAPGFSDPVLEKVVGLLSVAALLAALPLALFAAWRERVASPPLVALGVLAASYPLTLAVRLTAEGTETSNRASEFVFLGLGTAISLAYWTAISPRLAISRRIHTVHAALAAVAIILFCGGITVGWDSQQRLPGDYQVGSGARSVEPHGIASAKWARAHLPLGSRMFTDSVNKGLMSSYGRQDPQSGKILGVRLGALFFAPRMTGFQRRMIEAEELSYLVVDERLSESLPRSGRYFEASDPEDFKQPPSRRALAKFDDDPALDRIYSNGPIHIYDATRLLEEGGS